QISPAFLPQGAQRPASHLVSGAVQTIPPYRLLQHGCPGPPHASVPHFAALQVPGSSTHDAPSARQSPDTQHPPAAQLLPAQQPCPGAPQPGTAAILPPAPAGPAPPVPASAPPPVPADAPAPPAPPLPTVPAVPPTPPLPAVPAVPPTPPLPTVPAVAPPPPLPIAPLLPPRPPAPPLPAAPSPPVEMPPEPPPASMLATGFRFPQPPSAITIKMGTPRGFPNPPAMFRGERSSPAPLAIASGKMRETLRAPFATTIRFLEDAANGPERLGSDCRPHRSVTYGTA